MPVGGEVRDELLRMTGAAGDPKKDLSGAATTNETGVYFGADRMVEFRLWVGGTVSGTSPTLTINIQDSADNSSFATVASFPQKTASSATAVGNLAEPSRVAVRTVAGRPYLRVQYVVGGTTPVFNGVQVLHDVLTEATT